MIKKAVIYSILASSMFITIILAVYILMNRNQDIETHSFEHDADYYRLVTDDYMIRISRTAWSNLNKKVFAYKDIEEYLIHCQECIQYITQRTGKTAWMDELPNKSDDEKAIVTIIIMKDITSRTVFKEGNIILNEACITSRNLSD